MSDVYEKRAEFTVLYSCQNGVINGDPDADSGPRLTEDGHAEVSSYCLKRRLRDWVALAHEGEPGMDIFMQSGGTLATRRMFLFSEEVAARIAEAAKPRAKPAKVSDEDMRNATRAFFERYWDSMFGMVAPLPVKRDAPTRGPVQIIMGKSLHPVMERRHTVTRCATNSEEDKDKTMGSKSFVEFALYRQDGIINGFDAQRCGLRVAAVKVLWEALENAWSYGISDARGLVTCCGVYVWEHDTTRGMLQPFQIFDTLKVRLREGLERPACIGDYVAEVGEVPEGVTLTRKFNLLER